MYTCVVDVCGQSRQLTWPNLTVPLVDLTNVSGTITTWRKPQRSASANFHAHCPAFTKSCELFHQAEHYNFLHYPQHLLNWLCQQHRSPKSSRGYRCWGHVSSDIATLASPHCKVGGATAYQRWCCTENCPLATMSEGHQGRDTKILCNSPSLLVISTSPVGSTGFHSRDLVIHYLLKPTSTFEEVWRSNIKLKGRRQKESNHSTPITD